jgi:hypothetical protein
VGGLSAPLFKDTKMPKIYESSDGGITIRAREIGDPISSTITVGGSTSTVTSNPDQLVRYKAIPDPYDNMKQDLWGVSYERTRLIDKYPELKDKWEEYKELEKHYKAWDLLYNK